MQTRYQSFLESLANIAIGYFVSLGGQLVIFPMFDIHVSLETNIYIALWFTAIALVRSYVLRRWFNARIRKAING